MLEVLIDHWPVAVLVSVATLSLGALWDERKRRTALERRFSSVLDADAEVWRVARQARAYVEQKTQEASKIGSEIETLRQQYAEKRATYDRLVSELAVFDERLAFSELGIYEPHFEFTDSEQFKAEIEKVRTLQKELVSAKQAVISRTEWTVQGSRAKGKTMTSRNIKLTLRAFNGECDAAISNVRWNNANAMEQRIIKAREKIDALNESNTIEITDAYLDLKLKELRLTHEHREKLKQEKEDRAEAARLAREEQKLLRDLERAEEEERHYEGLLAKAKAEAARVHGEKLAAVNEQVRSLERALQEAHANTQRAQAMAERTKSGYVYIVSNVGSFGENVVKIGLTRRLDPADRVRELGDASVPFTFDTHAIIYSDNAPALERAIHAEFDAARINTQNARKEFFRVGLDEVEAAVKRLAPSAPFFKDIEAQEYRETLARRRVRFEAESTDLPMAI